MKLLRVRIGTLMLLVVIAALAVTLVVENRRHAQALAIEKQRYDEDLGAMDAHVKSAVGQAIKTMDQANKKMKLARELQFQVEWKLTHPDSRGR